jgi:hypothetical protein
MGGSGKPSTMMANENNQRDRSVTRITIQESGAVHSIFLIAFMKILLFVHTANLSIGFLGSHVTFSFEQRERRNSNCII